MGVLICLAMKLNACRLSSPDLFMMGGCGAHATRYINVGPAAWCTFICFAGYLVIRVRVIFITTCLMLNGHN